MRKSISKNEAIKGYKVFNLTKEGNISCRKFQYKEGLNSYNGKVKICSSGLHFCPELRHCFNYYNYNRTNHVVYEVEGYGDFSKQDDKYAVSHLVLKRRLSTEEILTKLGIVKTYVNFEICTVQTTNVKNTNLKLVQPNGFFHTKSENVKLKKSYIGKKFLVEVETTIPECNMNNVIKFDNFWKYGINPLKKNRVIKKVINIVKEV